MCRAGALLRRTGCAIASALRGWLLLAWIWPFPPNNVRKARMHTEPFLRGGRWVSDASAHLEAWVVGGGPSGWSALGPGVRYTLTFYTWGEVCFSGSMWTEGKEGLGFQKECLYAKDFHHCI